jgi:hypothetical protein
VPFSKDNPRFARPDALRATAEALVARLEVAARSPADARAAVAAVLASRAMPEERGALAATIGAPRQPQA